MGSSHLVCVLCNTQTDGHLGPGTVPTALAATPYTEQGAARDQPRTCTHHPPAADSRGVRREEAAGQYTRPRGDELGSGDVDGKGDEAEVVGMEAAGGSACGAVEFVWDRASALLCLQRH